MTLLQYENIDKSFLLLIIEGWFFLVYLLKIVFFLVFIPFYPGCTFQ